MDTRRPDRAELSIRFVTGLVFGAALGAWCALDFADLENSAAIAATAVVCGALAGLAAARYGDPFWHRCASVLRWWWP